MEEKAETIRQHLVQVARQKGIKTYTEVGNWVGLDMSWEPARIQIAQLLDMINENEINEERPMISALVVHKEDGRPGVGFFQCARGLGKFAGNDEDGFWANEVKAVHEYWVSH